MAERFLPSHIIFLLTTVYTTQHCMQFLTMLLKYQLLAVYRIAEWVT